MGITSFNSALSECLESLRLGASVDQCLTRYPRHARRLEPLLRLAAKVQTTPLVKARPQAQELAWRLAQERAAELRGGKRVIALPTISASYRAWLKPVAITAAVVLSVSAVSGGVAYASQDALPDSPLYRVKLATEDIHVWMTFDETSKAEILLDQSDERMEEIMTVVGEGKPVPENALNALHDRNQRAAGILAERPEETTLRARVLTQAEQQENILIALWPEVSEGARPEYTQVVAGLHNTRLGGGAGEAAVSVLPEELSGGILSIAGSAQQLEDGTWNVGGVEVRVDDRTIGHQELQSGSSARFIVARSSNGRLHALSLSNLQTGPAPSGAVVSGAVEQVTNEGITVAGQYIPFSDQTLQTFPVRPGERVQISLQTTPQGIVAGSIKPEDDSSTDTVRSVTFEGTIAGDVSRTTSRWTIGGLDFQITPSTTVDARGGQAQDGARAQVEALVNGEELQAVRVTILASQASADTVTVIGNFEEFVAEEGVWRVSGLAIVPPEVGDDPPRDALVSIDARRQGEDFVAVTTAVIEHPDDRALVRFQGTISQIDNSRWTLEFGQVKVASTAKVSGDPDVGVRVLVWGERGPDGSLQARYVRVLDQVPAIVVSAEPEDEPAGVGASD